MNHHISEIQIVPIRPQNGLVGFANFVLDNCFYLGSIGIISRPHGGYRLLYPTRQGAKIPFNVFYPINKNMAEKVEQAVIAKYKEITGN